MLLSGTRLNTEFIDTESQTSCLGPKTWTWSNAGKIYDSLIIICNRVITCQSFNIDTLETKDLPISIGPRYNYASIPIVAYGESETKLWITGKSEFFESTHTTGVLSSHIYGILGIWMEFHVIRFI